MLFRSGRLCPKGPGDSGKVALIWPGLTGANCMLTVAPDVSKLAIDDLELEKTRVVLVTNFGCWILFDHYAKTWSGLWECYTMAVPFFRYTVAGDLFFACMTFGGYLLVRSFGYSTNGATTQPHDA